MYKAILDSNPYKFQSNFRFTAKKLDYTSQMDPPPNGGSIFMQTIFRSIKFQFNYLHY